MAATDSGFASIPEALEALKRGELVVVLDDDNRENEGDLIMPAERMTAEAMTFIVRHTTGIVCCSCEPERLDELGMGRMVADNTDAHGTAFTVTTDYKHGTTTGVSSADRTATIRALADPEAVKGDFNRPGHIFPLVYRPGGVLRRAGHTEAAVDLARLSGHRPAGALCEIVNDDGTMSRLPELRVFAAKHGLLMITIDALIRYRLRTERSLVLARVGDGESKDSGSICKESTIETPHGPFTCREYCCGLDGTKHVAMSCGELSSQDGTLVYMHTPDPVQDVFASADTLDSSRGRLMGAMGHMAAEGGGVVLYLNSSRSPVNRYDEPQLLTDAKRDALAAHILLDHGVTAAKPLPSRFRGSEDLQAVAEFGVEYRRVEEAPDVAPSKISSGTPPTPPVVTPAS